MKKQLFKRTLGIFLTSALIISCIPAALSASAKTAAVPGAHIENGGFETGDLSGWSRDGGDSFSVITGEDIATSNNKAFTALYSSYCIKAAGEQGRLSQAVAVEKDTDYTVGYYSFIPLKTDGSTNNGAVKIMSQNGEEALANIPVNTVTAQSGWWRYNSAEFNSGDRTKILIDICLEKGTVYFDELYIKKANNLVMYGDFPNGTGVGWRGLSSTAVIDGDNAFGSSGGSLLKKSEDGTTYNTISVQKNTDYILTFYSKGCLDGNYGYIKSELSSSGSSKGLNAVGGADWKASSRLLNSGNDTTLKLYIQAKNVYFDNISVVKAVAVADILAAEEGGTVSIAESTSDYAEVGSYNTATAAADSDYRFAGWYNGDTLISKDESYTFKVSEGVKLTAKFTVINKADIINSGFEEDKELKDCGYSNISAMTSAEISNSFAHTGEKSLHIANASGSPHLFLKVSVSKNQDYTLRFFAKVESENAPAVQVKGTDRWGSSILLKGFGLSTDTEDWTEYIGKFNSGEHSEIYINFFGSGKEFSAYIDDITVAKEVGINFDAENGSVSYVNQYGTASSCLYGDEITAAAHPDEMYKLIGWKNAGEENYFSTEESIILTAEEERNIIAVFGFDGLGDLNGDGELNSADLSLLKKALLGTTDIEYNAANADVNRDSKTDIADFVALKKRIARLNSAAE